ncbi:MAG: cell division protein ZapD [Thioalkalivibrionaceae bacterium]
MIVFEQPLQERIRLFLRLETLFQRFNEAMAHGDRQGDHAAIAALFDLYALLHRVDIKRELLGELERQSTNLQRFLSDPGVDADRLNQALSHQEMLYTRIESQTGSLDHEARRNDFYVSLQQRAASPGGPSHFDLPIYALWQRQPLEDRHALLLEWVAPLEAIHETCLLALDYIRAAGTPRVVIAIDGFYEQPLDAGNAWQMLRIKTDDRRNLYPEVSSGRQRFTIRWLHADSFRDRPAALREDLAFTLTCCAL